MAQADAFLIICEVGLFNFTTSRYTLESEARDAAKTFWCCWVLYKQTANGTDLTELAVRFWQRGGEASAPVF